MQSYQCTLGCSAAAILLLLLLHAPMVSTQCPSDTGDWLLYKDSCYKYYNKSEFWYTAEMTCKEVGGHLVSIDSDQENRMVGKLSICQDTWVGRYARDLGKMSDPGSYAWTDESTNGEFQKHNFSEESSIHRPLIRSQGLSWYNSLYHEQHPFVCEVKTPGQHKSECPSTMKFYQGSCYLLSGFETSFIEANYFCQNHSTQLASVLNEAELRFINTLDLEVDKCHLQSIWLGLVKLNPCYPDRGGREMCYQWTDFSGKHQSFPRWAQGQPPTAVSGNFEDKEADANACVTMTGDELVSTTCSERHRFVCKVIATALTGDAWKALDERQKPIGDGESNEAEGEGEEADDKKASKATAGAQDIEEDLSIMAKNSTNETPKNRGVEPTDVAPPRRKSIEEATRDYEERLPWAREFLASSPTPSTIDHASDKASSTHSSEDDFLGRPPNDEKVNKGIEPAPTATATPMSYVPEIKKPTMEDFEKQSPLSPF